jgi:hypothetical protein
MLGAAGGHADYAGNEVDALALNVDAPQWVQLRAPSANANIINASQFYLDKRPSATHTYYATQFINSLNRLVVMPSPGMGNPGLPAPPASWPYANGTSNDFFSFSVDIGDWDAPEHFAAFPADGDFTAALVAKHPVTEDIYYSRNYSDGWYRWSSTSNTWTKLSNVSRGPWYAGSAIDPKRDRLLVVGGYNPEPPEVHALDGSSIAISFGGLGASALSQTGYPGVVYDEANDNYLALYNDNGSIRVLRVDAATFDVDAPSIQGTAPTERPNGIQSSVQYVPELKGIVIANSYSGNVFFLRTSN